MIQRLKSTWICIILRLLHVTEVCHALDLWRYPDGITAIDANDKCGIYGLENDPLVLSKINKLHDGQEFWTGVGIYIQLTDWIEILGCFRLIMKPSTVYTVSSPGLCQRECLSKYIGFNKETIKCSCLNNNEIQLNNRANLSSCKTEADEAVFVYETFNGTVQKSLVENGLCTTLTCTTQHTTVLDASCEGNANIKGLCEDGMQSTSNKIWGLPQHQTVEYCRNKDKLLLHSNACQHISQDLTARAWTNVIREEIEVERKLGYERTGRTAKLKFCQSATISDKGKHVLKKNQNNCFTKLQYFVCKNDFTTLVEKTYNTHVHVAADSQYGTIVGGSVAVILVLVIAVTLIICKFRQIGLFKPDTSTKTTNVVFTKSVNGQETTLDVQTQQHVNQGYGLVYQSKDNNNKSNDSYAQVHKVKRKEDTYAESTNEEYDHLHNIGGRKFNSDENTYDSNAGVRNHSDPTYDTATSSTRVYRDNTYDHSFTNMKTFSESDVSDSRTQIGGTNYNAYDQAC